MEPITYRPGWNGVAYPEGSNWTIANTLVASRSLTPEELEKQTKMIVSHLKNSGKNATVTKTNRGYEIRS